MSLKIFYSPCYECLLSYSNQLDALYLNRHRVLEILLELQLSRTLPRSKYRSYAEQLEWLKSLTDPRSELEKHFLDILARQNYRLPDDAQKAISEPSCIIDFFYDHNICIFCDGSIHDGLEQHQRDERMRKELIGHEYRVIVIRYDRDLEEQIRQFKEVFGGG